MPFAAGGEIEQSLRSTFLAERGLLEMVSESALDPGVLAAAVNRAASTPRRAETRIDLRGAQAGAAQLLKWASGVEW